MNARTPQCEQDPYSADADQIERLARDAYEHLRASRALEHRRDSRGHAMTLDRFEHIINWVSAQVEV